MKRLRISGFTLLELLVVTGIIGLLTAMLMPVVGSVRRKANMSREISAARQLMAAYLTYPSDNGGELLPGYGDFPAKDETGSSLHSPVNYRYPWRLAPYLKYDMRVLWGNNADDKLSKLARGPRDEYIYGVSVQPALGINAAFVGGDYQTLSPAKAKTAELYGNFCVTRLGVAAAPGQLIVFASAGSVYEGTKLTGYFKIEPPKLIGSNWKDEYSESAPPDDYGHVDFRYDGKAVTAMLDGHVEMMSFKQMTDMQRWSNQAALAQNSTWKLGMSEEATSSGSTPVGDHIDGSPVDGKK